MPLPVQHCPIRPLHDGGEDDQTKAQDVSIMTIDPSLGPSSEQADANFPSPPGLEVEEPGPVLAVLQNPEPDAPATHQPYLPPEITDDILDYLDAESDGPTLRACALAGRVLHPRARANLFRTLNITKPRDCRRAAAWFAEPQYARCVQHLMLNQSALESGSDEWDDETTAALLRCFHSRSGEEQDCSNQEMGDTCAAGVKTLVMYWTRVEEMPLTTAVLSIPSVTTLTFAYLWFTKPEDFRLFMNGFPALERLAIGGFCVGEASVPWNPRRVALPSVPMPRLYRLDLSRMREINHREEWILQWLLDQKPEDIHIKWLGYIGFRNGLELPPAVLQALGASVEHLCMGHEMCEVFDGRPQPGSDPLLEHLTSLRSIELHFKTREPEERIMFPMEDLMAQIKSKPRSIYINLEGACLPEVFRVDAWDLGDLDNALSFQSQYDQLEDVNVKISIYKDSPLEYERAPGTQMVGLVMSAMPEMRERGVLRVKMDYFG